LKVTEILKEEHQDILRHLGKMKDVFSSPNWQNVKTWQYFISFLKIYADKFHHIKEEDIYFPWMQEKNPELEHGPLKCMLHEHKQTRALISQADYELEKIAKGDLSKWPIFKDTMELYIRTLEEHIHKEDNVLYRFAEGLNSEHKDGDKLMLPLFNLVEVNYKDQVAQFKEIGQISTFQI